MGVKFWVKRFFTVLGVAFLVIGSAQMIKTHDFQYSAIQALIWSIASASVFTTARIYQSRQGQHCAICRDTPEMNAEEVNSPDVS